MSASLEGFCSWPRRVGAGLALIHFGAKRHQLRGAGRQVEQRLQLVAPWRAREYAINFGGHDEIVLMQSLDLFGLQRDRGITPTEADIRMMAFSFREFTNLLDKGKRLPEIAKPEAPLDAVSFLGGARPNSSESGNLLYVAATFGSDRRPREFPPGDSVTVAA
jgi:hypothetical protein